MGLTPAFLPCLLRSKFIFTRFGCAEPDYVDIRLAVLAQVMLKQLAEGAMASTGYGTRSVGTGRVWLEQALRRQGHTACAGLCGPDVYRGPLGSCSHGARASGTAAVGRPKNHLKGTLCPASNTQPRTDS